MPGEFHASEAAHLVAVADRDGDQVLSKEEVDSQKIFLLCLFCLVDAMVDIGDNGDGMT